MSTELILIRHGHAVRVNGHYVHAPLTPLGRKQAALTGKYFCKSKERLDRLYCSPLRRARETAAQIGVQVGRVPHIVKGVQELETVEVPQLVLFETGARLGFFGRYLYEQSGEPLRWPIVGRVSQALTQLVAKHEGERIAVVVHSGVISAVLAWYFPNRRRKWWRFTAKNCSLTRLRIDGRRAELLAVNDTNHLKPEVVTAQPPEPTVEIVAAVEEKIAPPPVK